jgi:methionyl-tRNA formyltransferase
MLETRLVFFGNERLVSGLAQTDAPVLRRLISDGYTIAAVVSNYIPGASRNNRVLEVADIAKEHGIPVLLPKKIHDIEAELRVLEAEAGILAAYGQIIPQAVIDIFPKGIINVHPSLLPEYRGPTPIETAISDGKEVTGISIMQLVAKMDAGPVYAQERVRIEPNETKFDLYNKIVQISSELLSDALPNILSGSLTAQAQDDTRATYSRLLTKDDSWINPDIQTAAEAERLVRAHLNFPKSKLTLLGHDVIIQKARVSQDADGLTVRCKDGAYLVIEELIAPSGKRMTGAEYIRGYGSR